MCEGVAGAWQGVAGAWAGVWQGHGQECGRGMAGCVRGMGMGKSVARACQGHGQGVVGAWAGCGRGVGRVW